MAKGGALRTLLDMAIQGKLTGKVVIFDEWTRAGRIQPLDAFGLLKDFLSNGVDLVICATMEYFTKDSNLFVLFNAVTKMNEGYEDSKRKSDYAKSKWTQRMEALSKGKQVALNNYPFWIGMERTSNGVFTGNHFLKKNMVILVKKIFSLYLSGIGTQKLASALNKEDILTPAFNNGKRADSKRGWYQGRILRLIKDRAVLGYYQDRQHGTEHKIFEPIISETDFYTANKKLKERVCFAGRKMERVNPFSGLVKCSHCGGSVSIHSTGTKKKGYSYLQCRYPHDKTCGLGGIRLEKFEESFWGFLADIDDLKLGQPACNEPLKSIAIQGSIDALDNKIVKTKALLDKALEKDNDTNTQSLSELLSEYDKQKAILKQQLHDAITDEKGSVKVDEDFINNLPALYKQLEEPEMRLEMQEALRTVIDKIAMDTVNKSYVVTFKNTTRVFKVTFNDKGKAGGLGGYTKILFDTASSDNLDEWTTYKDGSEVLVIGDSQPKEKVNRKPSK